MEHSKKRGIGDWLAEKLSDKNWTLPTTTPPQKPNVELEEKNRALMGQLRGAGFIWNEKEITNDEALPTKSGVDDGFLTILVGRQILERLKHGHNETKDKPGEASREKIEVDDFIMKKDDAEVKADVKSWIKIIDLYNQKNGFFQTAESNKRKRDVDEDQDGMPLIKGT